MQRSHCGGDVLNPEQLFDHIEGLLCYVGECIDAGDGQDLDLNEIYQWIEDILLEFEKQNNIAKRGETK